MIVQSSIYKVFSIFLYTLILLENILMNVQKFYSGDGLRRKLIIKVISFLTYHQFKGSFRLQQLISRILMPDPRGLTICTMKHGFKLLIDPLTDTGIEKYIYFHGGYEDGILHVMKNILKSDDIFIDVGSNIGLMALAASKFVGLQGIVYAFEPNPETFEILKNNIELNQLKNIYVFNIALGSEQGNSFIFNSSDQNRGKSSLLKPHILKESGKEIRVETLDEFVCKKNISKIKMLKIDVEGWELEVFKGAKDLLSSKKAPIICFEYSEELPSYNGNLLDLYKFIVSINNYKIFKLIKGKEIESGLIEVSDTKDLPHHDNLFCFLPEHLEDFAKDIFV